MYYMNVCVFDCMPFYHRCWVKRKLRDPGGRHGVNIPFPAGNKIRVAQLVVT